MRLGGKVAIITGASSGIGRASALRFAREGASVVVADIDVDGGVATAKAATREGGDAIFRRCDVTQSAEVMALVDGTVDHFGGLDILFANAAHMRDNHPVTETTEDDWWRSIAVTLTGPFLCAKYAIPHLIKRGGGSIIATTSVGGLVALEGMAAYCSAKGGLILLIKSIARDYGRYGIRANAIAPGRVRPPGLEPNSDGHVVPPDGLHLSLLPEAWAGPEDIASSAVFLASDDSAFVTGTVIVVDGGWSAHWASTAKGTV